MERFLGTFQDRYEFRGSTFRRRVIESSGAAQDEGHPCTYLHRVCPPDRCCPPLRRPPQDDVRSLARSS